MQAERVTSHPAFNFKDEGLLFEDFGKKVRSSTGGNEKKT
jgi:hypothetical protein